MIGNSKANLKENLDMVAANNLKVEGAGFQGDTNVLTLITQDEEVSLPLMSKEDAALKILDKNSCTYYVQEYHEITRSKIQMIRFLNE